MTYQPIPQSNEDTASANLDPGVPVLAVQKATPANTAGTDGDYEFLQMSAGRLWVDASGKTLTVSAGTGATDLGKAEDAPHTSGDVGIMALGVKITAGTGTGAASSDYVPSTYDVDGKLWVSGGVIDGASFVAGTSRHVLTGGSVTTSAPTYTTGQMAPLSLSTSGALRVTGGGGGTEYVVNDVAPADPTGATFVMERDDQLAALTEIEGDWTNPRASSKGALWVAIADSSGDPITSFGGGIQYTEGDIDATITGTALLWEDTADTLRAVSAAKPLPVDTELPAAVALANGTSNPTVPAVAAYLMAWNGTSWDRLGNETGAAVMATNVARIGGFAVVAHDGVGSSAFPLIIGGVARATAPADVSADGDAVQGWFLRNGAQATVLTAAGALIGGDAANGLDVDVTRLPALVAGSAIIGKVGIDQTTPGTTNLVALTAETTKVIGTVNQGTSPWVTADNQVLADNAAFTDGTSKLFSVGFIFDEVAGTALTENDAAAARIDSKRAQVWVLEDETTRGRRATVTASKALLVDGASGTFPVTNTGLTSLQAALKNEDSPSSDLDVGLPALVVRKATPANTSGADGDYEFLQISAGRLWASANIDQINGVAPLMGSGNTGTGSPRVTIATDQLALTTAGVFSVKIDQTTPGTTNKVAVSALASCGSGLTNVTTAGTRVALGGSTTISSVTIKAKAVNTGTIYVGNNTVAAANGFQLAAGDIVSLDVDNLTDINLDASVNGEGVTYIYAV
jgi:hypothetical protein